jgi:hypothetical protein
MASSRIAKVSLERLDRQAVTVERLAVVEQKTVRLAQAGVSYDAILARRDEMNALTDDGVQYDFNDAILLLYDETFGSSTQEEER